MVHSGKLFVISLLWHNEMAFGILFLRFSRLFHMGVGIELLCVVMNVWKNMYEFLRSELKMINCPLCVWQGVVSGE